MAFTGGAPAVVSEAFQLAARIADELRTEAEDRLDAAISQLSGDTSLSNLQKPVIPPVPVLAEDYPTAPTAPPGFGIPEAETVLDRELGEIEAKIAETFAELFETYFPINLTGADAQELKLSQAWIARVLSAGGAINPVVEDQIFERARNRALREGARQEAEVLSSWAARGYPLPPGAAVGAVRDVQRATQDAVSQAARDASIETYKTEVELQVRAVGLAIQLRTAAMSNMGEFVKLQVLQPRTASQEYANSLLDAQQKATQVLLDYYKAELTGVDIIQRGKLTLGELQLRGVDIGSKFDLEVALKRVDAAMEAAKLAATQAAAALNGIHATAGISGSDSTSTQLFA